MSLQQLGLEHTFLLHSHTALCKVLTEALLSRRLYVSFSTKTGTKKEKKPAAKI